MHRVIQSSPFLAAIADPTESGRALADSFGVRWFANHRSLLDTVKPQGAVVATPNHTHIPLAPAPAVCPPQSALPNSA